MVSRFGLWDLRDQSWIGDDKGPLIYSVKDAAMIAATILTERMRTPIVPRQWEDGEPRFKDEVTPKLTALEALERIEGKA